MAIELAVALGAIATKALVSDFIRGTPVTRDTWAQVATEVVDIMTTNDNKQASSLRQLGQRVDRLSGQIERIGGEIGAIKVGEFDHSMEAGRRHMLDLSADWRTDADRRDLIRSARDKFVDAVASARLMKDVQREALAEVAIAGCWLWVPSLEDVRNTIGRARQILEREVLFGQSTPIAAYADVLALAKSYGERSRRTAMPVIPQWGQASVGARLAVFAVTGQWVECAGVELKLEAIARGSAVPLPPLAPRDHWTTASPESAPRFFQSKFFVPPVESVRVTVRNRRASNIYVSLTERAILVHLTSSALLRDAAQILAGADSSLTLAPVGRRPHQPDERDWSEDSMDWSQDTVARWSPFAREPAWPAQSAGPAIGFLLPDSPA